jgi:hypothetical protein
MTGYDNTAYGMMAFDDGAINNQAGGEISVSGAGLYGMGVTDGTASNAGDIYVDGFKQILDADGNITGEQYWKASSAQLPSTGMVAGSENNDGSKATATNTGTIIVHNAGYGMSAMYGGTAINQGTITLTADGNTGRRINWSAWWRLGGRSSMTPPASSISTPPTVSHSVHRAASSLTTAPSAFREPARTAQPITQRTRMSAWFIPVT